MATGTDEMTSQQVQTTLLSVLKDHGLGTLVALACLYVGRQDVLLPLVQAHTKFLDRLATTQVEIAEAMKEQTRLLYAIQPRMGKELSATTDEVK